jgi:hypothetical protein
MQHHAQEQEEEMMRLTLDIDGRSRGWYAWGLYYMLKSSGEFSKVEIRRTRRGYHVIAWGSGLSEHEVTLLRMALGDDMLRVAIDSVKHPLQPKQVLWRKKNDWEVETLEISEL